MIVPFHKPEMDEDEIKEVEDTLRSGWLTTGPKTKRFEADFASKMGFKYAVALNSATAALHLALEAIGLKRGESVLVPSMTFAATAEVVRYFDAKPILIDCRSDDFNLDIVDARRRAESAVSAGEKLRAIIPVHYGGQVADVDGVRLLARDFNLNIIDDAAHCCPAYYRPSAADPWRPVGYESAVCCFSFYANKCITTGEGGMACTNDESLANRMRVMSLHGISKDAWKRFTAEGSWYYEIIAPGYKYNLTDIASAIGLHQLRKADSFLQRRAQVADWYHQLLSGLDAVVRPIAMPNRIHSWHLYVIRILADRLNIDRAAIIEKLRRVGITTSVHWTPLHQHPYYREMYVYKAEDYPVAATVAREIISLPIFPSMTRAQVAFVTESLVAICAEHQR